MAAFLRDAGMDVLYTPPWQEIGQVVRLAEEEDVDVIGISSLATDHLLVPKANIRASSDVTGQMFVDLGRLRAFKGSQRYAIPAGLVLARFQSVIVWCEQFSVLISPADLAPKGKSSLSPPISARRTSS